ncbi:MAG: nitrogen fixation protein NifH [Anaerolineae bacterium]|nr:nitrogen fixation protein NifH [Anaerolineae bacterium]
MAPLDWLLDPADPGPRYLALRDVVGLPAGAPELLAARAAAHASPPIAAILDDMQPEGYWVKPGPGYNPKYRSTVWALIALWQLGATAAADPRIGRAGAYLLDHALAPGGQFSSTSNGAPSGTVDCLQGNLLAALLAMGIDDPRLDGALEWMARTVTGEGIAPAGERLRLRDEPRPPDAPRPRPMPRPKGAAEPPRYYAYKSGPLFACGINGNQPCAWGGAKVLLAFGLLPAARRTPLIDDAIHQGAEYLLSIDPATAGWPSYYTGKPSTSWWKFGFPVFYVTDILQVVEALVGLGYGDDPRLANALALIAGKADAAGRWSLEYDYAGKMWPGVEFGAKRQPNKWVTIRALRALAGRVVAAPAAAAVANA